MRLVLPAALFAVQLTAVFLAAPEGPPGALVSLGLLVSVLAVGALVWRRRAPARVCAAVLLLDAVAEPLLPGAAVVPSVPLAAWIALYALAVHRPLGSGLWGATLATGVVTAPAVGAESAARLADDLLAGALLHLLIVLCGQLQRHRRARRLRVAARLATADVLRRAAAAAERERLAREVHDAAAHHLTAVAVHGAAALRRAGGRAEVTGAALHEVAASGRAALAALVRLSEAESEGADGPAGPPHPHRSVAPLCEGLERLGLSVEFTVEGRPRSVPPEVATAAHRIVQESLTNAMRYAAGAAVTVRLGYRRDGLTIAVANGPSPTPGDGPPLGAGRGLGGLAERAAGVGGRLVAGPDPRGGWSVRARLPTGRTSRPGVPEMTAFAGCALAPALLLPDPVVALPLAAAHALPLLWWRRAPVAALAAMLVLAPVCALVWAAVAAAAGGGHGWPAALACASAAELLGVHEVAARVRPRWSWLAPFAVGAVGGSAVGIAASAGPGGIWALALVGLTAAPWSLPVWLVGLLTRARGGAGGRWEERALEAMALRVAGAVAAERRGFAAGLRGVVLEPTARLVRRAEAGDATAGALAEITHDARRALGGLRELLGSLETAR